MARSVPGHSVTVPVPRLPAEEMLSVPLVTCHAVAAVVLPVSVHVAVPVVWKVPKPWYCAPIVVTLKVPLVLPPRLRLSLALAATTLPEIVDPPSSVRLLNPPVNVMALAWVVPSLDTPPVIVPLVVTVRFDPVMPAPPASFAVLVPATAPPLPPMIEPALLMVTPVPALMPVAPLPPCAKEPLLAPPLPPVMVLLLLIVAPEPAGVTAMPYPPAPPAPAESPKLPA